MRLTLSLFGALTSKPYAFKARSWELKSIETIDLFDSLCSNIKIDLQNSEILRILPINNQFINEEWISDKARFAFDGFKRERFINPMIRKKNIFIQVTWKEASNYIFTEFFKDKLENIIINTGNFIDIENIISIKKFLKYLSYSSDHFNISINNSIPLNADFQEYYNIRNNIFNITGQKVFLLIGINLRLENPILNIKLKKISINSNILIGYIGSHSNYNINCIHLGNNISILNDIIKGKHNFCMIFINFLKKNSKNQKILNKFKNNISIIFGNEVTETNEHINLIKTIKQFNKLFIKFEYNVLELYSGKINILEFGLFNLNKISKIKNNIFYLINSEILNYYKKGDFVIFQGDHNTKIREYFDVILPNSNWTETSNLYLNCFGYVQKSQFIILPPINTRENWKITSLVFLSLYDACTSIKYIFKYKKKFNNFAPFDKNSFIIRKKIYESIDDFSPNLLYFINKYKSRNKQEIDLIIKNNVKINIKKLNMPFKSFIFNYYQVTSVEKASKIMTICAKTFNDKKLNFLK